MSIHAGVGFSQEKDTFAAIRTATEKAKQSLGQDRIDAAILLNTSNYNPEDFLSFAYEALKKTKLIGASTCGIILQEHVYTQGIAVIALTSDETRFGSSSASHLGLQKPEEAAEAFTKDLKTDFGRQQKKVLFVFADGLMKNPSLLIEEINSQFQKDLLVIGAGSSNHLNIKRTYQYHKESCMTNGIAALLLGGRANIHTSLRHGFRPLGKPRVIDKTSGNIIKTIDRKSALELYREYFEKEAESLTQNSLGLINVRYPLGIKIDEINGRNKYLVKSPLGVLEDGSLVFQDIVPENTEAHIMIGTQDSCLLSAENAVRELKEKLNGKTPRLILVLESLIRYKILGKNASRELQFIREFFGASIPVVGMYSSGELFTAATSAGVTKTFFHNGSIMLIAIH